MTKIKKIFYGLFFCLFFTFFLNSQQNNFYWENEQVLESGKIGKFEVINNNKIVGVLGVENSKNREIFLRYSFDGINWQPRMVLVNDFYSNNPNGVDYSGVIDNLNNLFVCFRTTPNKLVIEKFGFDSSVASGKFQKGERIFEIESQDIIYLPSLFATTQNEICLTYLENTNKDVKIKFVKINGTGKSLINRSLEDSYKSQLNPYMAESNGLLYLVFQAKDKPISDVYFYNIILATSNDYGTSWRYQTLVESNGENNQRPHIYIDRQQIHLVWEKEDENLVSHINYKNYNLSYKNLDTFEISNKFSEAHQPFILKYNNFINFFWYDSLRGSFQTFWNFINRVEVTEPKILKNLSGRTLFTFPTLFNGKPILFWLQTKDNENTSIYYLKTDSFVSPPSIYITNINKIYGENVINKNSLSINWNAKPDISGVKGFKTLLTKDPNEDISNEQKMLSYNEDNVKYNDLIDGVWYFKIKAYDNAGNESKTETYKFEVDTIPPEAPVFVSPKVDESGDLTTNSPTIAWDDITGESMTYRYYYKLFTGNDTNLIEKAKSQNIFDKVITTSEKEYKHSPDFDNGKLLVGVQGIDKIGNISDITWEVYNLNKYIVRTIINNISIELNKANEKLLNISGRGYAIDGKIEKIIIDKDREEPYDYVIPKEDFIVYNDFYIKQIKETYIEDGSYYIGLYHPVRGTTFDRSKSLFSQKWAFKYEKIDKISFDKIVFYFKEVNLTTLLIVLIISFWAIIVFVLFVSIVNVGRERIYLKMMLLKLEDAKKILNNEQYEVRSEIMRKKGVGLTVKYTLLILSLVIMIVGATAFSISYLAIQNERRNLANEMKEKALIVVKNFHASVMDIYILQKGYTEVVDISNLTATFQDIGFVFFKDQNESDPIIRFGEKENVSLKINNFKTLDAAQKNRVVSEKIYKTDLKKYIEEFKTILKDEVKIYPVFDADKLQDSYIFTQPIIIEENNSKKYIGELLISYSFERILKLIEKETYTLLYIALIVSTLAIFISIIGSIFLATTTIRPIKRMVKHVELITSKEDYEDLVTDGKDKIIVRSKDEIGNLADSINEMTHKLIEKAKADKQLLLGKEIQKKFITLNPIENDQIDIYGFYEGAKGVSGDYFEYRKIDDNYYAFIICDVSGKAVPAALIMVQISTIFHSYFANFKMGNQKPEKMTVDIITQINDTVEERGFEGRFAATLVLILNVKTGVAYLTNAGYTQLLVYRDNKKECEWIKLFPSGAAGVFPSYMLPQPFQSEKINVNNGDVLFLFTDGIEEARCGDVKYNEKGEEIIEEFGLERLKAVIESSKEKSSKAIIDTIMEAEAKFRNGGEQYDDLTLLAVKRK